MCRNRTLDDASIDFPTVRNTDARKRNAHIYSLSRRHGSNLFKIGVRSDARKYFWQQVHGVAHPSRLKSQANEIKDRLVEGPASTLVDRFAKEAQSYSKCPSKAKGGSLGEFAKGTMVPEFDEIAFSAPVGTLQGPISTRFGYHLIIVTDRPDKN